MTKTYRCPKCRREQDVPPSFRHKGNRCDGIPERVLKPPAAIIIKGVK